MTSGVSSAISGHDQLISLPATLGHPFWFATPENEWETLFFRYIPRWLAVADKKVLAGYYEGDSSFYTPENLRTWLGPLAWWSLFYFVTIFVTLCGNSILRKQWVEREKLSYPIIQLPLAMTSGGVFWKKRLLWIGFAIAASLDLINGLHFLIPAIPYIPIRQRNIGHFFTEKPLNAIGWLPISFYPFAIGLCFFAPLDLTFSVWFFYLFGKAQRIVGAITGWQRIQGFPYYNEQLFGAALVVFVFVLWGSREHLGNVFRKAFRGARLKTVDDSDEPLSYRAALSGIAGGFTFLILFCGRTGMSPWAVVAHFSVYFILWTTITRIRAQLGPPVHALWSASRTSIRPDMIVISLFGTRRLGPSSLTMHSFFWGIKKGYRGHPAPHQLEGFKLAEQGRIENRRLLWAILLSTVAGIVFCIWAMMHFSYKVGAPGVHYYGGMYFNKYLPRWLAYPSGTEYAPLIGSGMGALFAAFLMLMRWRFVGWPFHPVGYVLSGSWTINLVWFVFLLSWIVKFVILKHGGLRAYKKATPFFFGLILGEFIVGGFWTIVGIISGRPSYAFWY